MPTDRCVYCERNAFRDALRQIVRAYEFRSELYPDDETCAGNLYDWAKSALNKYTDNA